MEQESKTAREIEADVGGRVRALRFRKNLTQSEVAKKAGISRRALVNLEKGNGTSLVTVIRVLKALDVQDILATIVPAPTISPLAVLRRATPPQRVRRPRKNEAGQ